EIQAVVASLPASSPDRHQDRLGTGTCPGAIATPDLSKDDPEADCQLGPPVGGVQPRLTQEREQVVAVSPQVLGQALVGRVPLGREDQVGQLVLQTAAGHGQSMPADFPGGVTVAQVKAGPEQFADLARDA